MLSENFVINILFNIYLTSLYKWKILEWDDKPRTNNQLLFTNGTPPPHFWKNYLLFFDALHKPWASSLVENLSKYIRKMRLRLWVGFVGVHILLSAIWMTSQYLVY